MPQSMKMTRQIVLMAFCIVFLMSSCQSCQSYSNPPGGKNSSQAGYPDVLKLTRCLFIGDTNDNPDLKEEFMKVFSKKTGINLEVNYPPRNNYMKKVDLMVASGEIDGLVNFFTPNNVMQAIRDNTIEPLDEYLKDNKNWNSMSEEYRSVYKINGKVYAIPAGYDGTIFTRSFRKDWLDNLGMKAPETADELFEVARAFTEDDPDGNGINDTNGLTSSKFWNLQDIFQAFDVMLGNTGETPITWDPLTGVWQDSMLKPEMADALAYIKKLYDFGYLDPDFLTNEGSNMREKLWTGKSGSTFYWFTHGYRQAATEMRDTIPEAKWIEVPAIKGKRLEKLNHRVMGGLIYVLVKGTKQSKETVNTFIDIISDQDKFFMFRYGIEGKMFRRDGNKIIILTDPDTGQPYETPGLANEMPQFNRFKFPWCYDGTEEELRDSLNVIDLERYILEEGIRKNLVFDVNGAEYDSPISTEFSKKSSDIIKLFEKETSMAILGEKTIEQALEDYRKKMKKLGAGRILDEANAFIGRKSYQVY